ncbi:MAG: tetratricopeptide repeat protein [Thermoplasmata archaeon]
MKESLEKDAATLLLDELGKLTDSEFAEVMEKVMEQLKVEPRKVRNKPSYYYAEVVSVKDQKREVLFVSKEPAIIGALDVDKLANFAEKVRAPRSTLITLGEISKDAEKNGAKRGVLLISGPDLANLIRKAGLEDKILKEFAVRHVAPAPPGEDKSVEGQIDLGIELLQAGEFKKAIERFERAIAAKPDFAKPWKLKGDALEQLGEHSKALECFGRALEIDKEDPELWYSISKTMYSIGRYEEQMDALEHVLKVNPDHEKALADKGATLLKQMKFQEALDAFNRLLKLNPRNQVNHNSKGIALKSLNRMEEALAAFEDALSLDPDYVEALINKAMILIQLGRSEEALASLDRLIALRPEMSQAWSIRGDIESKLGRKSEAIRNYERALELDPTNALTKKLLDAEKEALQKKEAGITEKITTIFKKVRAPAPQQAEAPSAAPPQEKPAVAEKAAPEQAVQPVQIAPTISEEPILPVIAEEDFALLAEEPSESAAGVAEEVFGDAAELMILMNRPEIALTELEKGLRLEPLSPRMLVLKGVALHALGRTDEALKMLGRAVEIEPTNEEAIYSVEYILSKMGKYGEAEETLQPLIGRKEWAPEILAAMDSAAAGKMNKVSEHIDAAISLEPSATAWNYKGLIDLEEGAFEESIEAFERARQFESVFSDPTNNIGVAQFKLGNLDDAGKYYDLAISSDPKNHVAWSNRGVLLTALDRYKEAKTCFDQSLLLKNDPLVLINKGFCQLKMDELDEALRSFDASLVIKETPEAFNNKGIVLERMGKKDEAMECFEKAVALSPEFEDAKKNLERLRKEIGEKKKAEAPTEIPQPPESVDEVWKRLGDADMESLSKLRKTELMEICATLRLSEDGTKHKLVQRILDAKKARAKKRH